MKRNLATYALIGAMTVSPVLYSGCASQQRQIEYKTVENPNYRPLTPEQKFKMDNLRSKGFTLPKEESKYIKIPVEKKGPKKEGIGATLANGGVLLLHLLGF